MSVNRHGIRASVEDALAHYWDPGGLETNPLVDLLSLQPTATESRAASLRKILAKAIASLRPEDTVPYGRPEWTGYRLLQMRYLQSRSPVMICEELGLGRSTFYRLQREALEAVARFVWEEHQCTQATARSAGGAAGAAPPEDQARLEVEAMTRESHYQAVDLTAILSGALRLLRPLAQAQGMELHLDVPSPLPTVHGDPAVLRQVLLNVLGEGLKLAGEGGLSLVVSVHGDAILWRLQGLDARRAGDAALEHAHGFTVSRALLGPYGGRLIFERCEAGSHAICLALPVTASRDILVVDDNPDTQSLYRLYLQSEPYHLRMVQSADQVACALAERMPDLILLDVLMPGRDGWDILEKLKTMPATRQIPVVVCSVLSQPRLALALGAAEVLQKPFAQAALLNTISQVLRQRGSAG